MLCGDASAPCCVGMMQRQNGRIGFLTYVMILKRYHSIYGGVLRAQVVCGLWWSVACTGGVWSMVECCVHRWCVFYGGVLCAQGVWSMVVLCVHRVCVV